MMGSYETFVDRTFNSSFSHTFLLTGFIPDFLFGKERFFSSFDYTIKEETLQGLVDLAGFGGKIGSKRITPRSDRSPFPLAVAV